MCRIGRWSGNSTCVRDNIIHWCNSLFQGCDLICEHCSHHHEVTPRCSASVYTSHGHDTSTFHPCTPSLVPLVYQTKDKNVGRLNFGQGVRIWVQTQPFNRDQADQWSFSVSKHGDKKYWYVDFMHSKKCVRWTKPTENHWRKIQLITCNIDTIYLWLL